MPRTGRARDGTGSRAERRTGRGPAVDSSTRGVSCMVVGEERRTGRVEGLSMTVGGERRRPAAVEGRLRRSSRIAVLPRNLLDVSGWRDSRAGGWKA